MLCTVRRAIVKYKLCQRCCASTLSMYRDPFSVNRILQRQTISERAVPHLNMRSNYHLSNAMILATFALCNSIIAIVVPVISSSDLLPRGRRILNPIECDAELPIFPPGLQSRYHNLRNICSRDSIIPSGNMGCGCINEILFCPSVADTPPWLSVLRNVCLRQCDCGVNTKRREISIHIHDSIDLTTAPWDVKEDGPNPFRDIASLPMGEGTCTSCFTFGSSVLPRDGGNCTCVNSSSITPRDDERGGHARIIDGS